MDPDTQIHVDLKLRADVTADKLEWKDSPVPGRRMLDRDGGEVAQATTIVQYEPNQTFPFHTHEGGEEFLVMQGTFCDPLSGDNTVGYYVRNPIGSSHEPFTKNDGCTIFVKLRQMFDTEEKDHTIVNTYKTFQEQAPSPSGISRIELHHNPRTKELVGMERWKENTSVISTQHFEGAQQGGLEILLVSGDLAEGEKKYKGLSWIRLPPGYDEVYLSTQTGCEIWVKTGHLAHQQ